MIFIYWIKFQGSPPVYWKCSNMDEFWHRLREEFIRQPRIIEWMIRE